MHLVPSSVVFAITENGLTFVVFGTVAFSLVMSVLFLVTRGTDSLYDHIGAGGLTPESDYQGGSLAAPPDSPVALAEQEAEVRQMLRARSERLVRKGEPALDIDAEVSRLLGGANPVAPTGQQAGTQDAGLLEEVRQLVFARNERRVRQGLEPLDVEGEVARTLAELEA